MKKRNEHYRELRKDPNWGRNIIRRRAAEIARELGFPKKTMRIIMNCSLKSSIKMALKTSKRKTVIGLLWLLDEYKQMEEVISWNNNTPRKVLETLAKGENEGIRRGIWLFQDNISKKTRRKLKAEFDLSADI